MTVTTSVDFASAMQAQAATSNTAVAPKTPACDFAMACQAQIATPAYTVPRCNERAHAMKEMKRMNNAPASAADYSQALRAHATLTTRSPAAPVSDFASACATQAHLSTIHSTMSLCQERAMFACEARTAISPAPIPAQRSIETCMPATSICNERAMYASEVKEARKLMRTHASSTPTIAAIGNICTERTFYAAEIKQAREEIRQQLATVTSAPNVDIPAISVCNERVVYAREVKQAYKNMGTAASALPTITSASNICSERTVYTAEIKELHQLMRECRDAVKQTTAAATTTHLNICNERASFSAEVRSVMAKQQQQQQREHSHDFALACQAQSATAPSNANMCLERAQARQQCKEMAADDINNREVAANLTTTTTADYAQALPTQARVLSRMTGICGDRTILNNIVYHGDFAQALGVQGSVETHRNNSTRGMHTVCHERAHTAQQIKTANTTITTADFARALNAQAGIAATSAHVAKETTRAAAVVVVTAPTVAMATAAVSDATATAAQEIAQQRRRSSILQALRRLSISAQSQLPCAVSSASARAHRLSVGPVLAI